MFRRLIEFIRKQVSKIFPTKTIEEKIDTKIDISDIMIQSIELWSKMYEGDSPWLDDDVVKSLGIPASVASEMARLVTIEMESEIIGEKGKETDRSKYLNERYQRIVDSLRIQTEYATAKGGLIFKPYIDDNGDIAVEYVQADSFYPVEFNSSGDLIAVIFPEILVKGDTTYTRLEYHHLLKNNRCYISNAAYVKDTNAQGIGVPTSLKNVPEWEDLEPEANLENIPETLFSYFKMPLANNKDTKSHLGVSVYSKAKDLIKEGDKQYSKILWEYEAKETAIDVPIDLFLNRELPKGKERLFRQLDVDDTGKDNFYKVFNPEIRDESLFNGLNKILERVEFNCGLAYGTLSDIQETSKTATEIRSSKQRSYSTIVDIQKALRISLEHLVRSMEYLTDLYDLAPKGEIEISFDFDDSIVVDTKEEQAIMMNEVAAGLIKPEKYLMTRYGVSEEEAKEMLPNLNDDNFKHDDLE